MVPRPGFFGNLSLDESGALIKYSISRVEKLWDSINIYFERCIGIDNKYDQVAGFIESSQ